MRTLLSKTPGGSRIVGLGSRALDRTGTMTVRQVRIVTAVALIALLAAASFLGYVFYQHHDDQSISDARRDALSAAVTGAPKLLSYKAADIDAEFTAKYTMLAGKFAQDFRSLSTSTIIPQAKEQNLATTAQVVSAGVTESSTTNAKILLFINQSTTSNADQGTKLDGSRVQVAMTKVAGSWKIAGLTPV